jgi:hypothetical protein
MTSRHILVVDDEPDIRTAKLRARHGVRGAPT